MITIAEADILLTIFSVIFTSAMLICFTVAVFIEKYRRNFAIVTGVMAACLLVVMAIALAAPYIFPL